MDGRFFLGTAHFLSNDGNDEAAHRSAMSRAYYACFLVTRTIVFNNCCTATRTKAGIKNERSILHKPLQQYLKNSSDKPVQRQAITADDAEDAIANAEAFLKALDGIGPISIGEAVEEYIAKTHR